MDFAERARNLELDEDEFRALLGTFASTTFRDIADAERALARGDFPGVAASVHSIKGASAGLELQDMYETTQSIERAIRSADTGSIPELLESLRTMTNSLRDDLTARNGSENAEAT